MSECGTEVVETIWKFLIMSFILDTERTVLLWIEERPGWERDRTGRFSKVTVSGLSGCSSVSIMLLDDEEEQTVSEGAMQDGSMSMGAKPSGGGETMTVGTVSTGGSGHGRGVERHTQEENWKGAERGKEGGEGLTLNELLLRSMWNRGTGLATV